MTQQNASKFTRCTLISSKKSDELAHIHNVRCTTFIFIFYFFAGSSEFDWTSHTNDLCSSTTVTTTNNSDCKSSTNLNNFPSNQQRRKSTSSLLTPSCTTTNNHHNHTTDNNISNSNTKISNSNLVLQQLRVALKKLPESAKLTKKPLEAVKRRHSDCGPAFNGVETGSGAVSGSKKPKWAQGHGHHRRPFSASMGKGQGKITEYLPEMKHFIAMRKEKLDRVLNLGMYSIGNPYTSFSVKSTVCLHFFRTQRSGSPIKTTE